MTPELRVRFPGHESTLKDIFQDLRKVGIRVDGKYLKAKMMKVVSEDTSLSEDETKNFKATDAWLKAFNRPRDTIFGKMEI